MTPSKQTNKQTTTLTKRRRENEKNISLAVVKAYKAVF